VSSDVVISASGVSKKFCRSLKRSIAYALRDVISEVGGGRHGTDKLRTGEFWALHDISLRLTQGKALGLVGPNGSGKSTLLRLISGLIKPDTGELRVRGIVAPLIALGAGFNPVLTGRENVFVNMAILGLRDGEIRKRFDEVLEFAEIGEAIDAPVQTYSSGMVARLGFACAVHTSPDIMLIDEVLSVGDVRFRSKCYRKLTDIKRNGTAFVLVSHSSNAILSICDSALYISSGKKILEGEAAEVMARYEADIVTRPQLAKPGALKLQEKAAAASLGLDILEVIVKDAAGQEAEYLESGAAATIGVKCLARKSWSSIGLYLILRQANGELEPVLTLNSERDAQVFACESGTVELQCHLPSCGLKPGVYSAKISVVQGSIYVLDAVESFLFEVRSSCNVSDSAYFQHREWRCARAD
jgi:lipopolysaccharide transport system ATP-binding protein